MFVPRVLIVHEDAVAREAIASNLPRERYSCEMASWAEGLARIEQWAFDVVLAEVRADGVGGLGLVDRLRREQPSLPVILVASTCGVQEAVEAIKRGAFHYLVKPCDPVELRAAVDEAIVARRRSRACDARRDAAQNPTEVTLIGRGPVMLRLAETIDLVAASSAPVLVTGQSGAGKEVVARAIHARGSRSGRPFIAVNTSAIPDELLEAEVFGHVRGSFTGAAQTRKGLLTEASGGTLLLDEIGDMPLGLQAKLLRVLQFGEVRPVGSDRAHHVDVRIIAATHRDLPAFIRENRFREDLYFRLNVLPVTVPSLGERREDIPELVLHLLSQARERCPDSPVQSIEPDALDLLASAPWPGNVRELANVVERIVVFGREARIGARDLSFLSLSSPPPAPGLPWGGGTAEVPWTLRRLTDAYTEHVLAQTGGNKQRAAKILDVDLSTLYRWERRTSRKGGLEVLVDARAATEAPEPAPAHPGDMRCLRAHGAGAPAGDGLSALMDGLPGAACAGGWGGLAADADCCCVRQES